MSSQITIDFGRVEAPSSPRPVRPVTDKMARSASELDLDSVLPSVNEMAPGRRLELPREKVEAAKATYVATGGNVSQVAKIHDLDPGRVAVLAAEHKWPVYGEGMTSSEKGRKAQLVRLASVLENKLFQLADAMGIETKEVSDITEKGLGSRYIAPLTQRSSAFSAVFDRYMRVMALLEPELFGQDDDPSNPVAAKLRARNHRDALGGVDGVDRQLADFAARVAVSAVQAADERKAIAAGDLIDVEVEA